MKRVAYLGTDSLYPALEALLGTDCRILKIFTCRCDNLTEFNTGVISFAWKHQIPYTMDPIGAADLEELRAEGCQLLLAAGYAYAVPVTDAFPMVKFHPAPLPACRGPWPEPWILLGAYSTGGVTLHRMEAPRDTGDILLQETFPLEEADTLTDYMRKAGVLLAPMVRQLLANPEGCLAAARPQGAGRYLPNPNEKTWAVREDMPAEEADRILRAFYGHECLYVGETKLRVIIGGRVSFGRCRTSAYPVQGGYIVVN